jgi:hypothetical protein
MIAIDVPRPARLGLAWAALALAGTWIALLPASAAMADPASPSPSAGSGVVTKAGTSFLTAVAVGSGQQVKLGASTGDFLYWSFRATAGQTSTVTVTVALPAADTRNGGSTWTVDVFDGLRRRQACTAGMQSPTAAKADRSVTLGCTLREVRAWAEPWSGDPLPGTYYVRLAAADLPEQDLGLPIVVDLSIESEHSGDPAPEGGELRQPLVAATRPGAVLPSVAASPSAAEEASDWLPAASTRWIWTAGGGVLAAVAGVLGYALTRRPMRGGRPVHPQPVHPQPVHPTAMR